MTRISVTPPSEQSFVADQTETTSAVVDVTSSLQQTFESPGTRRDRERILHKLTISKDNEESLKQKLDKANEDMNSASIDVAHASERVEQAKQACATPKSVTETDGEVSPQDISAQSLLGTEQEYLNAQCHADYIAGIVQQLSAAQVVAHYETLEIEAELDNFNAGVSEQHAETTYYKQQDEAVRKTLEKDLTLCRQNLAITSAKRELAQAELALARATLERVNDTNQLHYYENQLKLAQLNLRALPADNEEENPWIKQLKLEIEESFSKVEKATYGINVKSAGVDVAQAKVDQTNFQPKIGSARQMHQELSFAYYELNKARTKSSHDQTIDIDMDAKSKALATEMGKARHECAKQELNGEVLKFRTVYAESQQCVAGLEETIYRINHPDASEQMAQATEQDVADYNDVLALAKTVVDAALTTYHALVNLKSIKDSISADDAAISSDHNNELIQASLVATREEKIYTLCQKELALAFNKLQAKRIASQIAEREKTNTPTEVTALVDQMLEWHKEEAIENANAAKVIQSECHLAQLDVNVSVAAIIEYEANVRKNAASDAVDVCKEQRTSLFAKSETLTSSESEHLSADDIRQIAAELVDAQHGLQKAEFEEKKCTAEYNVARLRNYLENAKFALANSEHQLATTSARDNSWLEARVKECQDDITRYESDLAIAIQYLEAITAQPSVSDDKKVDPLDMLLQFAEEAKVAAEALQASADAMEVQARKEMPQEQEGEIALPMQVHWAQWQAIRAMENYREIYNTHQALTEALTAPKPVVADQHVDTEAQPGVLSVSATHTTPVTSPEETAVTPAATVTSKAGDPVILKPDATSVATTPAPVPVNTAAATSADTTTPQTPADTAADVSHVVASEDKQLKVYPDNYMGSWQRLDELAKSNQHNKKVNDHIGTLLKQSAALQDLHQKSADKADVEAKLKTALDATYQHLLKPTDENAKKAYDAITNDMQGSRSKGFQILGGILLALGIAIAVLGAVFFPVLVGVAVGAGLATVAATAITATAVSVTAATSTGVGIGFFAKGMQKNGPYAEISKDMDALGHELAAEVAATPTA